MAIETPEDFYKTYSRFKAYERMDLRPKHIRWYDREFWEPAKCDASKSVLEIGCGTGHFLSYLKHKGVETFQGIDLDEKVKEHLADGIAEHVQITDVWDFLEQSAGSASFGASFDRIVMLDVLEHFSAFEAAKLLQGLKGILAGDGLLVIRVPNVASPWGHQHQYGDLTHKTAYTPDSLRQLALASGYEAVDFLGQRRGSPFRRFAEDTLHCILSGILTETPAIWSANMIGILKPGDN